VIITSGTSGGRSGEAKIHTFAPGRYLMLGSAKTHLSRLLGEVEDGEVIVIARGGKPVARLIRFDEQPGRVLGRDAGLFTVPDTFDDPLPDDVLGEFFA